MQKQLEGGCLCGRVRYRITRPPIDAGYCHCRLCQRASGAPVLAWLTVAADGFAYQGAVPASFHSSRRYQREFCAHCGTQIAFRRCRDAKTVDVTLASLDDPTTVAPQYHIWRQSRIGWFDTADRLPRHADAGPDTHDD
ncbi:GFA family protein [Zobellella endophytica]|uniref:GFA family protein n=1 Tax=Zobellella endophytica TaxID=2116700 RepID=A0A2P7R2I9_9GAMM|nr:GFA family protein [Zobellella endophytica]PSJ44421.1 GFA family protein [Zobellella endophytica]